MRYPGDTARSRTTFPLAALLLTAMLAVIPACGARGTGTGAERVPLVVENQNFYQATIYAILNGGRVRVGNVQGGSTETLQAPSRRPARCGWRSGSSRWARSPRTPVTVQPGDTVRVTVPPDLHLRPRGP
jgi:hypothetical protein